MTNISVIIPAFNEAENIGGTIKSIQVNDSIEIVVVDNGSTDTTVEIVTGLGVHSLSLLDGTIASVRNFGARHSSGDILVFVDADVRLTEEWHQNISAVVDELSQNRFLVTGSRCQSQLSGNLLDRFWYSELANYPASYINSGHLITSRALFEKISGFSENLETAEDYDFCVKAKAVGAVIQQRPELSAVHVGYPKSLWGFIRREQWHGRQDVSSWSDFLASKIAWFAALNLLLLVSSIVISMMWQPSAILYYFLIMYCVSMVLTLVKFGPRKVHRLIGISLFFYFYLCGRSLAILERLAKLLVK